MSDHGWRMQQTQQRGRGTGTAIHSFCVVYEFFGRVHREECELWEGVAGGTACVHIRRVDCAGKVKTVRTMHQLLDQHLSYHTYQRLTPGIRAFCPVSRRQQQTPQHAGMLCSPFVMEWDTFEFCLISSSKVSQKPLFPSAHGLPRMAMGKAVGSGPAATPTCSGFSAAPPAPMLSCSAVADAPGSSVTVTVGEMAASPPRLPAASTRISSRFPRYLTECIVMVSQPGGGREERRTRLSFVSRSPPQPAHVACSQPPGDVR